LFPARRSISAFIVGEAPGPRGADRSGIPFWGDRSGRLLYAALAAAGMADVPAQAWASWDGTRLVELGLRPRLHGVALSNAVPYCPTKDGRSFCAPSARELYADENRRRMIEEIRRASRRCPGTLEVIALGRKAEALLRALDEDLPFTLLYVPHPSAQALAVGRPGVPVAQREADWRRRLLEALMDALPVTRVPRSSIATQ
jgi:hypothetical protein